MDIKIFENELNKFEVVKIKEFTKEIVANAPEYIESIPASSSGKYHSAQQCEEGGLVVHIKLAYEIMNYILELEFVRKRIRSAKKRDMLRAAILLHDCYKSGYENTGKTVHEHPLLAEYRVVNLPVINDIPKKERKYIGRLIASHSGQWTTSKYSKITLPKLITKEQFLVHLCDYLASRKNIILRTCQN